MTLRPLPVAVSATPRTTSTSKWRAKRRALEADDGSITQFCNGWMQNKNGYDLGHIRECLLTAGRTDADFTQATLPTARLLECI